uniref:UBC core domain-containing protein n=1 Tax=Percolomonas cosmopolitus TaxID=63605 RepID=A0A7S1KVB3_9EUKA|mmetsp:Transcript_8370/g.30961  ORF Transcript_8370/g.30961 Transcript_8370/m.30961 type:complete len:158 (+) Transcript_8370:138-611(+)|eukprot:CAMPEP_0117445298 /NCGR_PEP_ID=MMETSP0759-20121206/5718_1 /TAXON_ID=63605 /ORGANISM="Percolomonas cosmopolitus, Strain WS" /LENGTH=157 /DNA_ID=CAMNT_0005237459 /DNA_START=144 /DNA_END=617 /DNA_ORIENTATION=+
MAQRRLLKEFQELKKQNVQTLSNQPDYIQLQPHPSNMMQWTASFEGPEDTPYEGGKFHIKLTVPSQYPIQPPKASFVTPVFHPNVHFKTGEICLDILKETWSPAWTLLTVCRAIRSLLGAPEADSPLNCDAGNLLRYGDERGFKSMASMYTKLHAKK